MTKQEKIREHLIELFEQTPKDEDPGKLADAVLWVLNEDSVVIKVERLLPFVSSNYKLSQHGVYVSVGNEALNEQGYVAVEPLIK